MPAIRPATITAAVEAAAASGVTLTSDRVVAIAAAAGATRKADVLAAVAEHVATEPKRAPKAPLTLSQRRALLRLAAVPDGHAEVPLSGFRAMPLERLVEAGLAARAEVLDPDADDAAVVLEPEHGAFVLTDEGRARAAEINPKWLTWTANGEGEAPAQAAPTCPLVPEPDRA